MCFYLNNGIPHVCLVNIIFKTKGTPVYKFLHIILNGGTNLSIFFLIPFPCRRAQSYLKFLGSTSSFRLNDSNIYIHNLSFPNPKASPYMSLASLNISSTLKKSLMSDIKPPEARHVTRHLSQTDFYKTTPTGKIHHSSSLQTLLRQEDMRGTSGGISERFKNFKNSSQNIFSKKMTALKAKLSDSGMIDEVDNRVSSKKKKKLFKRTVSESNVMAEILVRSVIHAHNSLDCIQENHDNFAKPALQKQQSLIDSRSDGVIIDRKAASDFNVYLDTQSSNATSCESSSSSDEDDNLSDIKDDDVVLDTVSDIVKNVEILERRLSLQKLEKQQQKPQEEPHDLMFNEVVDINDYLEAEDFCDTALNDDLSLEIEIEQPNVPLTKNDRTESKSSNKIKTIIPITPSNSNKPHGLFQTAMQTMLMEKVNLVGTYTPPTSPKFDKTLTYKEHLPETKSQEVVNENRARIKRSQSPTSFSLMDFDQRETVLGAPFKSVNDIKQLTRSKSSSSLPAEDYHPGKKSSHFHISLKPFHGLLKHKHKAPPQKKCSSSYSLSDSHDKESFSHWLGHMVKHKKQKSQSSLVDHKELKEGVFKQFASLRSKLKHKKHKRSTSPASVSLAEFMPRENDTLKSKPTSVSLADLSEKDGVLGSPEMLIDNFKRFRDEYKNKMVSKEICSEVKETKALKEESKDLFGPRILSNPPITSRRRSLSESAHTEEYETDNSKIDRTKSEIVRKPKRIRTYSDSENKEKQKHEWDFNAIKHKLSGSLRSKPKEKSKGLLKTALQTVLMESVNDILATSHSDAKGKPTNQLSGKNSSTDTNQKSEPTPNHQPLPDIAINADGPPVNTKIDIGNSNNNINTPHARLTPSLRNVGSPQPELNRPETGHHRTESVGAKISHSPAKISMVPSMHRRSSDSDLSITPKGT